MIYIFSYLAFLFYEVFLVLPFLILWFLLIKSTQYHIFTSYYMTVYVVCQRIRALFCVVLHLCLQNFKKPQSTYFVHIEILCISLHIFFVQIAVLNPYTSPIVYIQKNIIPIHKNLLFFVYFLSLFLHIYNLAINTSAYLIFKSFFVYI